MEYAESYVNTFTDDELSYRVSKRCIVFFAFLNFYGFLNFFRQRFFTFMPISADSQPKSISLVWGRGLAAQSAFHQMNRMNSRNDSGHDDSTINIVVVIITISLYYYFQAASTLSCVLSTTCSDLSSATGATSPSWGATGSGQCAKSASTRPAVAPSGISGTSRPPGRWWRQRNSWCSTPGRWQRRELAGF